MILRIDPSISLPVYAQIVDQIKRAIASGSLRTGDCLPSLRETAINLRINPLTVGKAYKQLEQEGLIETKHGLGSYVTAGNGATDTYRRDTLSREIDNLIVDAFHMGVTPKELKALFDERAEAADESLTREDTLRNRGVNTPATAAQTLPCSPRRDENAPHFRRRTHNDQ